MTSTVRNRTKARAPTATSENLERAIADLRAAVCNAGTDAFAARAVSAIAKLAASVDAETLTRAAGAPSDFEVLLQALASPSSMAAMDDPLAEARLLGIRYRDELLQAEGGVATTQEVAELLRISRQAVDKRRKTGKLIGLSLGRRGYLYPRWQFGEAGRVLAGLEEVLAALSEWDAWTQAIFMLNPNLRLDGVSPTEALRRGRTADVIGAAQAYGEHGAA